LGLEGAHAPASGWILRAGGTIESGEGRGFHASDDLQLELGCGQDDGLPANGAPQPPTIYCNAQTDYALHARGGWSIGALAGEAGLLVRSDSFRHGMLDRAWLVSPDVVARFTGTVGDLSFGGGAYDTMTLVSPGLYVRGRWVASKHTTIALAVGEHELGPWGEHPHLRVDVDFAFGIGARSQTLFGFGFAILRGGTRIFHGCPDCSAMTSAALHFTLGYRFD
jgi:hypothetical protein